MRDDNSRRLRGKDRIRGAGVILAALAKNLSEKPPIPSFFEKNGPEMALL